MARREAKARRAERALAVLTELGEHYPLRCGLTHADPLQLLVATILSAQATDESVNRCTPALFARYPDAEAYADAQPEELQGYINSIGLFRNKAKHIRGAAALLVSDYGGEVPATMDDLLRLPGVARKTANVVLGTAFGLAEGVVVDTHVLRVSYRLGFTTETNPVKIERDLMALWPRDWWIGGSHALIWHGRKLCVARKPKCAICPVLALCPRIGVED